ncbi:MAG: hypothetical protein H7274_24945 [Rhodoferax sp.]|nr:hypothetical protein [Rhodoferax sp.]
MKISNNPGRVAQMPLKNEFSQTENDGEADEENDDDDPHDNLHGVLSSKLLVLFQPGRWPRPARARHGCAMI